MVVISSCGCEGIFQSPPDQPAHLSQQPEMPRWALAVLSLLPSAHAVGSGELVDVTSGELFGSGSGEFVGSGDDEEGNAARRRELGFPVPLKVDVSFEIALTASDFTMTPPVLDDLNTSLCSDAYAPSNGSAVWLRMELLSSAVFIVSTCDLSSTLDTELVVRSSTILTKGMASHAALEKICCAGSIAGISS